MDPVTGDAVKAKFLVRDENGEALRVFWSRPEAEAFCLPGYTVERQETPAKPSVAELLNELGEGRF